MTRASDELLNALTGLHSAAERELEGEGRETALRQIGELYSLLGADHSGAAGTAGAEDVAFGPALAEVKRLAERELSGNAFYLVSDKLGTLGALSPSAQVAPAEATPAESIEPLRSPEPEPVDAYPQPAFAGGRSFEELGAAAKARVDQRAADFGIEGPHSGHHNVTPSLQDVAQTSQNHEMLAATAGTEAILQGSVIEEVASVPPHSVEEAPAALGFETPAPVIEETPAEQREPEIELERRSSEPCSMAELIPPEILSPASPPVAPVDVESVREVVEAAHDLGSAPVETAHIPEYAAPHEETPTQHEPVAHIEPEPEPAPAVEPEPEVAPIVETKHEPDPAVEPEPEPEVAPAVEPEPEPAPAVEPEPEPEVVAVVETKHEPAPVVEPEPEVSLAVEAKHEPAPAVEPEPVVAPVVETRPEALAPEPAVRKIETGLKKEPKEKDQQKTFFSLWLDMVFGRKKK